MRLDWRPRALEDLTAAAAWSERQAGAVVEAVQWMADTRWHSIGRRVRRGNARGVRAGVPMNDPLAGRFSRVIATTPLTVRLDLDPVAQARRD